MAIEFDADSSEQTPREHTVVNVQDREVFHLRDEWTTESDETITREDDNHDAEQLEYER